MKTFVIQISENCWKHTNKYGDVCYRRTPDPCSYPNREDGPAVERSNGDKAWWINGKLHRLGGPAVECSNGDKEWWVDGKCHRLDGPAIEFADGRKYWYMNGKLHRKDGPAVEYENGDKVWWLHGECIDVNSQEEFEEYIKTHKSS